MAISSYDDWMKDTAGSFYESRNEYLRALDQAIRNYHAGGKTRSLKDAVAQSFNKYIRNHSDRKAEARGAESWKTSVRNKNHALENLKAEFEAVLLPDFSGPTVPQVTPIPRPFLGPPIKKPFVLTRDSNIGRQLISKGQNAHLRVITLSGSKNSARILSAWTTTKSDLTKNFALHVNTSLGVFTTLQTAAMGAYEEYTKFVSEAAQETQAKIDLAKSIFEALESGPFPLSVVGKVGAQVCGLLKVADTISQGRQLGEKQYFDQKKPYLDQFISEINSIKNFAEKLVEVGVSTESLSSRATLFSTLDKAKNKSIEFANKVFDKVLTETYGDGPVQTERKINEFLTGMRGQISSNGGDAALDDFARLVITKIEQEYRSNIDYIKQHKSFTQIEADDLQPYIELQLFAEYMAVKVPSSAVDLDVEIPAALIARLESPAFGLLLRKNDKGQTAQIYSVHSKIPWDDHPKHRGAIILFLRWYKKNVNPFKIAVGTTSKVDTDKTMREAITQIGNALQLHTVQRTLRHATADWEQVVKVLS
jgi:hypothetical protein